MLETEKESAIKLLKSEFEKKSQEELAKKNGGKVIDKTSSLEVLRYSKAL